MHVPDGFLSPQITVPAYAVSAPLWAWGVRRHFGRDPSGIWLPECGYYPGLDRFLAEPARPQGLADDFIRCLLPDRSGALWIGTNGGLHRMLSASPAAFERCRADNADPANLP